MFEFLLQEQGRSCYTAQKGGRGGQMSADLLLDYRCLRGTTRVEWKICISNADVRRGVFGGRRQLAITRLLATLDVVKP